MKTQHLAFILFMMVVLFTTVGVFINKHRSYTNRHFDCVNDTDSLIADETYQTDPKEDGQGRTFIITYNDLTRQDYINNIDYIVVDDFYSEEDQCKITWFMYSNHLLPFEERPIE